MMKGCSTYVLVIYQGLSESLISAGTQKCPGKLATLVEVPEQRAMTDGWRAPDNLYGLAGDLCPWRRKGDLQKLHLILDSRSFMASYASAELGHQGWLAEAAKADELWLDTSAFIIANGPPKTPVA